MLYKVKVVKVYRRVINEDEVANLEFNSESEEALDQIISLYNQDFGKLFGGLVSLLEPLSLNYQEYENLDEETLRVKLKETLERCTNLESVQRDLQKNVSDLSETKLRKEKDDLNNQLKEAKKDVKSKEKLINDLEKQLKNEKDRSEVLDMREESLQEEARKHKQEYKKLVDDRNNLAQRYNALERQVNNIPYINQQNSYLNQQNGHLHQENSNLRQEIEKLKKFKSGIEAQKSSFEEELKETQKKLSMAMARLHGQTEKSGIAGGGSRSDKLKNDFENLKRGLFREASNKVLECWKKQDSALNQRSEEFSEIRSVLSQRVFIDGMSFFAGDKSEVKDNARLIVNQIISIEGLNPPQGILQVIEQKIETVLLKSKGVDGSNESLTNNVEATTNKIQEDLQKIRGFDLSQDVLQEIKNFVEAGLKLVQEIVNDSPSGEFYAPEVEDKFDENLHDTRDEPEGKVKLTICAGYRIPGTVLVKADVVTIPETPPISGETNTTTASGEMEIPPTSNVSSTSNFASGESEVNISNTETASNKFSEGIYPAIFKGTVSVFQGVKCRTEPSKDPKYFQGSSFDQNTELNFDAWTESDEMIGLDKSDRRWYKVSGQQWWVPAVYIDGEPPNSSPFPPNQEGNSNE
ncbi:MAG: hypothetical protein F6K54_17320 [Okeania sp. SIO3B5]|uniref:hypothetical protein n=1 Tax=Okeania sp. SIO3B5 TaxID=2607811 RepID=UPI001400B90F|nr:hypothetical protein [Okeania sp. SIO3B5]NEO54684.1 hypothetical protein [Okeania sp. SIO3B5]